MTIEEIKSKIDRSKFRGKGKNRLKTRSLFYEFRDHVGPSQRYDENGNWTNATNDYLYNVTRNDKDGSLGLQSIYLEIADLTEYEFANICFESWDHWQKVANSSWMKRHIEKWRKELELKLQGEAIKRIKDEAIYGGKNAYQANKWLAERSWEKETPKETIKRGRPSKQEIKMAATEQALEQRQVKDDLDRLLDILQPIKETRPSDKKEIN